MKKILLVFTLLLGMHTAYSQCTTGASIGTLTPTGAWQTVAVAAGVPAYRTFNGVAGATYTFTYCQGGGSYTGDPYLTVANNTPTGLQWNDDFCGLGSEVTWNCTATGTYRLYFSGCCPCSNAPTATLAYRMNPPANDLCAGAIAIANPSTTTGNTATGATTDNTACNNFGSPGMWYSVVGDGQQYTASLCGSSYDTWLSVYTGNCAGLTCVVQNDDACGLQSTVTWCSTLGTTYYILVNGFSTQSGAWTMALTKSAVAASASPATVCSGSAVTLTASGGTTYTWTPGPMTGASVVVNPTSTTTYTVSTTVGSCTITRTTTVTVNALPTVTANTTAAAVCTGNTVTFTGGGASSYTWTGGVTNGVPYTPASTSTYTVTGTDGNGCTNTATTTVTVNALPTVTASAASGTICNGNSETLTASGASTYAWSSGGTAATEVVSPSTTSTYTVTGTDGNGCSNTATVAVNVNALPTVTASSAQGTICDGEADTLTGVGAVTYAWSSGGTNATEIVSPTTTTTYTVTGTDGNGCSNTATVAVNVNALPAVTASAAMGTICDGSADTLMAAGASTYAWSSGGTSATEVVMPSSTSTYTVTGTDANGCMNTATIAVNVNANPVVALGADSTQCGGSVTLDAMNAGATYLWNDSTTAQTLTASMTGAYYVTVTDANGCWGSDSINVTINANPTVDLGADSTQCGGTITLDAMNAGSTYVWSDNSTAQTLVVSASGNYYVDVTDANGCMGSDSVMVTINTLPTVTASAASSTVCLDDADVALTGSPAGGTWSGPGVTGSNFDPSSGTGAQTLTYSYTDSNGCSGSANTTVTVNACVGITEPAFANGVNVYPNPNSGSFTLSVANNVGDMNIEITDATGRVVYSSTENNVQAGFNKQISMEGMADGIYMMRLTTGGEQQIIKISVQN